MPFGKYKNVFLVDVPEAYFVWFKNKGFPPGKLGQQMASMHENIKNEMHNAGIEILSPHYNAVRDGNSLTVPPENIPKDYKKTGFKIGD